MEILVLYQIFDNYDHFLKDMCLKATLGDI